MSQEMQFQLAVKTVPSRGGMDPLAITHRRSFAHATKAC